MKLPQEGAKPQGDPDIGASRSRSRELNPSELRFVVLIQAFIFFITVYLMLPR